MHQHQRAPFASAVGLRSGPLFPVQVPPAKRSGVAAADDRHGH
ncbi:Hypothetical protein CAP_5265 [Chondromyces apiculatus DSM 436]|uniref:Uncharacterized protein n=1 Tax=Chondromyces apiculatus DSM 436 TaxID=1192034 RepID=A0A017T339_9BACT|nr:Hypothetical protein CAP_5265 [Chondromyces apiculatus DSM 436]